MIHVGWQIPLKLTADESWSEGDSRDSYLDPSWSAGGLGCRTAEELLGSLSWAFWRRVCPTVSLLLAGRREASGGTLLQAHYCSRSCSHAAPHWAEVHREHPRWLGCGRRHHCGTPTCGPVPQGQPHHVAAQVVGKAVHPLVIKPVSRCLLQLTAGQGMVRQSGAAGALCNPPSVLPQTRNMGAMGKISR